MYSDCSFCSELNRRAKHAHGTYTRLISTLIAAGPEHRDVLWAQLEHAHEEMLAAEREALAHESEHRAEAVGA